MPKIDFAPEFKKAQANYDYPKLKLKKDEQARILIYEQQPQMEYVHTMRAPKVVMGKPVMETKTRRDSTQYQDYAMDFLSRPICLGDFAILQDKGSDPRNCPMCALAAESSDMCMPPQSRFAVHVIKYKTKPGSTKVAVPFSVDLVVWSFTDRTYGKLLDFKAEWGDLRQHDVTLLCTNEPFQLYDINISPTAEWLANDDSKRLVVQTYKENQIPDLAIACGSRKEKRWIDEDVAKVRERWAEVAGAQPAVPAAVDLSAALDDVFTAAKPEVEAPAAVPAVDHDEDLVPARSVPKPAATQSEESHSLDDLLADLDDV